MKGMDVYIIQSSCGHVNDHLMELLIMINACKIASAAKVTAVLPFFPYSKQPSAPYQKLPPNLMQQYQRQLSQLQVMKAKENTVGYKLWTARSGTLICNLITSAGANNIITMDLHDPQFQGFFDIPVDNLLGMPLIVRYIKDKIVAYKNAIVVSPDAGGAKRATVIAQALGCEFALIHKDRRRDQINSPSSAVSPTASTCNSQVPSRKGSPLSDPSLHHTSTKMMLVGDVQGKDCILIDDIADTCSTITRAANLLVENGAKTVFAIVTHGILSGDSIARINNSKIDHLILSNTVPQDNHIQLCSKIDVFDVSGIFAEAIRRIHNGESVSVLFE